MYWAGNWISAHKPLCQLPMAGVLRESSEVWRLILLSLFLQLLSHGLHLVLSLIPSSACFGPDDCLKFFDTCFSLRKLLVGAFSFVTNVSVKNNFIPSLFSKFFFYHWNLGRASEMELWMWLHISPLISMKLLGYCMHCWMLSTYDKYQQRLSWLSARKQTLATGQRINIDTGKTFSKRTWKLTYTSTTKFYKFYKVHINSLSPIFQYVLMSDTRAWSNFNSNWSWNLNFYAAVLWYVRVLS